MRWFKKRHEEETQDVEDNSKNSLESLTPKYEPEHHKKYVDWLVTALTDQNVTNIALAGMYGTGKSSILQGVVEILENKPYKEKVISISLAPLVSKLGEVSENTHGGKKYSDELQTSSDGTSKKAYVAQELQTFDLEKEIVKQLVYGVKPKLFGYSKFQRTSKRKIWLINIILGTVFALVFSIFGFGTSIFSNIANNVLKIQDIGIVGMISVFVVLLLLSFALLICLNMTGQIKSISIGKTSVDFTDTDESYFDKYLDEIVNLFESAKIAVVIFEDLDRFNNDAIFDSLHDLNRLLNTSLVSKRGKQKITFIYAIRDGIFKNQSNQNNEYTPFNRAKFFDLIIPVVPFIGKSNAKHLKKSIFGDISSECNFVVDIAASYIPDARTLKNVANEFTVYKETLMKASNDELGLTEANLLAFLFYKNYYPSDAEKIQYGESYLDKIYDFSREIVEYNLTEKEEELYSLEQKISIQETANGENEFFEKLNATFKNKLKDIDSTFRDEIKIELAANTYYIDGSSRELWDALEKVAKDEEVRIISRYASDGLSFRKKDILYFVDLPSVENIYESSINKLEIEKERISGVINNLKNGSLKYLFKHTNLGLEQSNIRKLGTESGIVSLSAFIETMTGEKSGLLPALVSEGLIENDYMLYSAVFPNSGISKNAMNYCIHNVNRSVAEYRYDLTTEDIYDILKENPEFGRTFNPALLNISLFDYCIDNAEWNEDSQPKNQYARIVSTIFDSILTNNQVFSFMSVYLSHGNITHKLNYVLPKLSGIYSRIFPLVLSNINKIPETILEDQLNTVLLTVNDDIEYEMPDSSKELWRFRNLILNLPIIEENSDMKSARKVAEIILKVRGAVNELGRINRHLWLPIIELQSFALTRENVSIAYVVLQYREDSTDQWKNRDFDHFPSLNEIQTVDSKFFDFVLKHIEDYIHSASIPGKKNTCYAMITGTSDDEVAEILNAVSTSMDSKIFQSDNAVVATNTGMDEVKVKTAQIEGIIATLLENSNVRISRLASTALKSPVILQALFKSNTLECSIENLTTIKEKYIANLMILVLSQRQCTRGLMSKRN